MRIIRTQVNPVAKNHKARSLSVSAAIAIRNNLSDDDYENCRVRDICRALDNINSRISAHEAEFNSTIA